jgi:hypothetical protein
MRITEDCRTGDMSGDRAPGLGTVCVCMCGWCELERGRRQEINLPTSDENSVWGGGSDPQNTIPPKLRVTGP